jgi:DNA uptake protein ComE-like DNA-binding protein
MIRKILREFYLLPRGEQRAMILLSLLLVISLGIRITVQMLPGCKPAGMEQFLEESRKIMADMAKADSLAAINQDSIASVRRNTYPSSRRKSYHRPPVPATPINLNTVDSAGLLPLPGIGPVFAGRIIKYRNLLGGFAHADQLNEVYGIDRETVLKISPILYIDTSKITRLDLDSASFRELLRHPYLEYEDVKAIVKYRDRMGPVLSIQELRENMLVPDSILEKIGPYLQF